MSLPVPPSSVTLVRMSIGPIAVELRLLRQLLGPELKLNVGRELMVRVADLQPGGRGVLSLAGMLLEAQLPEGVQPGDELRLQVRDLTPDRVLLAIQPNPDQPVPAAAALPPPVQLPGGGRLQIRDQQHGRTGAAEGDQTHTLALHYDAPAFGPIDMLFVLDRSSLRLALTVAPGRAHDSAQDHQQTLTEALAEATGRPATVTIAPRREPLEVYA